MTTKEEPKAAVSSVTLWAVLLASLPAIGEMVGDVVSTGALPPKYAAVVTLVGAGLAALRRLQGKHPPIKGVVSPR